MKMKPIFISRILALFTLVLFQLFFSSCNKNDNKKIEQPQILVSEQHLLTHAKIVEAQQALDDWRIKALSNISSGKYSNTMKSYSDGEPAGWSSLVSDTNFVNLLYHAAYGNLSIYDHYSGSMNTNSFNQFITAAYQQNATLENIFDQYGQSADPFLSNISFVLADAALINYNNTDFNMLSEAAQIEILKDAIDFYFHNDPSLGTPPSGIQFTSTLLNEISDCLFDAVGGFLIGNYGIIRDIYGALTGSQLGYAFVYNMAGRILKQAFNNAGGWVGISLGFAWCMIF